jgi:hypothetical protein
MICDWSPSNKQSLFNPNIASSRSNKLFEDNDGRTLCYECIGASDALFVGKKINHYDDSKDYSSFEEELGLQYDDVIDGVGEENP